MNTTRPTPTRWKVFLAGLLSLALAGCLPVPIIDITPSTAYADSELTFDGSGSMVSNVPKDNVAVSWAWDFGDGQTAKGETVTHTYARAGTYTVKLTVTDSSRRSASTEDQLVVREALPVTTVTDTTDETTTTDTTDVTDPTVPVAK